jgi:Flp pilus assembly protein TadD
MLLVEGRIPEAAQLLQRAAQLDPSSPVIVGSLGMTLALAGRANEAIATAQRAVSFDSSLLVTRFMEGATRLYLHQAAQAVPPLEAAVRLEPTSRTALGLLGYAQGLAGDANAARRTRARVELLPGGPGSDVAIARISIALGDTADALTRLERAARSRDPFFSTEYAWSPIFEMLKGSARYTGLLKSIGIAPGAKAS